MPARYMPDATIIRPSSPGGAMRGGKPRAVWHTTESGQGRAALGSVTGFLILEKYEPHIVWDPISGGINQLLPATESARSLVTGNRDGSVCIQIEVCGHAVDPFTDGPMAGFDRLMAWLDSWGIERSWPGGRPLAYPKSYGPLNGQRTAAAWAKGGHYGHSQVPGNLHGDPGAIDISRWAALAHLEHTEDDVTPQDKEDIAELVVQKLLTANLGRTGPTVAVALQDTYNATKKD
jgi:hypothetical protein